MNATRSLAELRPPLDGMPPDERILERILRAGPEPSLPSAAARYRRPLALAGLTAALTTAGVAALPSGQGGAVGLERAVAALSAPDVLLHFKMTTTHLPSGAARSAETWQTPDGRRSRTVRGDGIEIVYDQRGRVFETYVPERDEVIVAQEPSLWEDERDPFGSIATSPVMSDPSAAGDLAALLERALSGQDPKVRHVGRTTIEGIDVDHVRVAQDVEVPEERQPSLQRGEDGESAAEQRRAAVARLERDRLAPRKTVTIFRDVYVRHDNALPVRVVDRVEALGNSEWTTSVSEFTDVQRLKLDSSTATALAPALHPGAERVIQEPMDDSRAEQDR